MVFFPKNKRHFVYRSQRRVFVALFLFVFIATAIVSSILKSNAESGPVASVVFRSQNSSFENVDAGAWKVTKTAKWTGAGKAEISFDVVSRSMVAAQKPKDIVFVIDNSSSMEGYKLDIAKNHMAILATSLLDGTDNQIALISFNHAANILSDFSDDASELSRLIQQVEAMSDTNYYAAIKAIEQLLENHPPSSNRELIILFLTDGMPIADVPNEVAEFQIFKSLYPQSTVNGILYEMSDTIPQELINVSDYQYVADMQTLYGILLDTIRVSSMYDEFSITDYINDTYWTVASENAITVDKGSASLSYDGSTPIISWNMDGLYRSGTTARMTIEINLKDEYLDSVDSLLPTNRHTFINSKLENNTDENEDKNSTPILKDVYTVAYDSNTPSGCVVSGTTPDDEVHSIYARVAIADNTLSCEDYEFKGWYPTSNNITYINDENIIMPAENVLFKARWSKLSISKSMDGGVNERASATFDLGNTVNEKIRRLSGEEGEISPYVNVKWNEAITDILRATSLSSIVDINDSQYILSSEDSGLPIYGWYNNGIIYWYTDADDVYLNENASGMFKALNNLGNIESFTYFNTSRTINLQAFLTATDIKITNIEPLRYWDVSNVKYFTSLLSFRDGSSLVDYSAIDGWDLSNAEDIAWMLSGYPGTDLTEFSGWIVDNVKDMSGLFYGAHNLTSLTGLEGWETGNVTRMSYMFLDAVDNVKNLKPLKDWDTSNVTDMANMFYSEKGGNYQRTVDYGLEDISDISGWDVSKVRFMDYMFYGMNKLTDVSALSGWQTDSLEETPFMFYFSDLRSLQPLSGWNMNKNKYISYMFCGNENLTTAAGLEGWGTMPALLELDGLFALDKNLANVSAIRNWDVSKVKKMQNLFYGTEKLKNINDLNSWTTTSLEDTQAMFYESGIETLGSAVSGEESGMATWDASHITNTSAMFYRTKSLTDISALSTWITSSLTNMNSMFDEATKIQNVNALSNWDVSKVTDMAHLFCSAYSLSDISGLANWTLTNLENASSMFRYTTFTNVDALTNWNAPKLKYITYIFQGQSKLSDLTGLSGPHWSTNIANVESLEGVFYNVSSITNVDALASWNINKVTNTYAMFRGATHLANVNGLSSWNVSKMTSLNYMFYGAKELTNINGLSTWYNDASTSKLTTISYTFYDTGIADINALANWKTPNLTTMNYTFSNNTHLTDIGGLRNWNTTKLTSINNLFSGDSGILDLEPIFDWDTTKLTNKTDAFTGIPDEIDRPTWY